MRRFTFLALLTVALSACTQDTTSDLQPLEGEVVYATIEDEESRIQLNKSQKTVWTANDRIVIHGPSDASLWTFNGNTGDRDGTFRRAGTFNYANYTSFGFTKYYAVYPYESYAGIGTVGGEPAIIMGCPATQSYVAGSYSVNANTMIATSNDGSKYQFKNMFGYIRLSVTGDKIVKKIELNGNNSETIAGDFYFKANDPYSLHWYNNTSQTITLNCPNGVQLSDTPVEFYFALPPTEFAKGISASIHFSDGSIYPKSSSKTISIERNAIQPMATISTSGGVEWQYVYMYHTCTELPIPVVAGNTATSGSINWGDGTTTLIGELTRRYYYSDANASHTITIKAIGADRFELENCEGVTKIDLSEF